MRIVWRAFLAVLAPPYIVAMVVPVVLVAIEGQSPPKGVFWIGLLPTAIGVLILLSCVRVFIEEEPLLRSRFGDDFEDYAKRIHRWVPRLPPVIRGP